MAHLYICSYCTDAAAYSGTGEDAHRYCGKHQYRAPGPTVPITRIMLRPLDEAGEPIPGAAAVRTLELGRPDVDLIALMSGIDVERVMAWRNRAIWVAREAIR